MWSLLRRQEQQSFYTRDKMTVASLSDLGIRLVVLLLLFLLLVLHVCMLIRISIARELVSEFTRSVSFFAQLMYTYKPCIQLENKFNEISFTKFLILLSIFLLISNVLFLDQWHHRQRTSSGMISPPLSL